MTSPDLIHELKASRPAAPAGLRASVRAIAAQESSRSPWPAFRLPVRRLAVVAMPAMVALAIVSAGVLGLARSDGPTQALRDETLESGRAAGTTPNKDTAEAAPATDPLYGVPAPQPQSSAIGPTDDRAQRISATLTVEVSDSEAVSRAAQDALDLTRRLGGHVVNASVATGEEGSAALTVRVPVAKVQEAIVQLSALGRIVAQQVPIDDLQEGLAAYQWSERSVRAQIAVVVAKLESQTLDAETRARLESRLRNLRTDLLVLRRNIAGTKAEARMATIQLAVVTPDALGAVPVPSRLDRTVDEAVNVLLWEGVVALAIAIVAAPFALVAFAAWLGRRLYRRREEDRLLAT
ncbi:hypothetical protein BH09ACT13_BH09ACT13_03290 [soil metagenome]